MPSRIASRLARIEQRLIPKHPAWPFCVEVAAGESDSDAWQRHVDRYGQPLGKPFVVMAPTALSHEQWLAEFGWRDVD